MRLINNGGIHAWVQWPLWRQHDSTQRPQCRSKFMANSSSCSIETGTRIKLCPHLPAASCSMAPRNHEGLQTPESWAELLGAQDYFMAIMNKHDWTQTFLALCSLMSLPPTLPFPLMMQHRAQTLLAACGEGKGDSRWEWKALGCDMLEIVLEAACWWAQSGEVVKALCHVPGTNVNAFIFITFHFHIEHNSNYVRPDP